MAAWRSALTGGQLLLLLPLLLLVLPASAAVAQSFQMSSASSGARGLGDTSNTTLVLPPWWFGPHPDAVECAAHRPCTSEDIPELQTKRCPLGTLGAYAPASVWHDGVLSQVMSLTCHVCYVQGTYCAGTVRYDTLVTPADVHNVVLFCPLGYWCPNTYTQLECPPGFFCPKGSSRPLECAAWTSCPAGSTKPQTYLSYMIILVFVCAFIVSLVMPRVGALRHTYQERMSSKFAQRLKQPLKMWLLASRHSKWVRGGRSGPDPRTTTTVSTIADFQSTRSQQSGGRGFRSLVDGEQVTISTAQLSVQLRQTGAHILNAVSVCFEPGKMHGLFGPSGCGKSTLLTELLGRSDAVSLATSGVVRLNGHAACLNHIRRNIGFIPQDDILPEDLTVHEALSYAAQLRGEPGTTVEEREATIEEVERLLDIASIRGSRIGTTELRGISGGQRKRVSVGVELVTKPIVLIADELTTGLDATTAFRVMQAIHRLCTHTGMTAICSIHQARPQIYALFDNIVLLSAGSVVYQGSPSYSQHYFKSLGFHKPEDSSTPDFLLDVVSGLVERKGFPTFVPSDLPYEWSDFQHLLTSMDPGGLAEYRRFQAVLAANRIHQATTASLKRSASRAARSMTPGRQSSSPQTTLRVTALPPPGGSTLRTRPVDQSPTDRDDALPAHGMDSACKSGEPLGLVATTTVSPPTRVPLDITTSVPACVTVLPGEISAGEQTPVTAPARRDVLLVRELLSVARQLYRASHSAVGNTAMSLLALFAICNSVNLYLRATYTTSEETVRFANSFLVPAAASLTNCTGSDPASSNTLYCVLSSQLFVAPPLDHTYRAVLVPNVILLIEGLVFVTVRMTCAAHPAVQRLAVVGPPALSMLVDLVALCMVALLFAFCFMAFTPMGTLVLSMGALLRLLPWVWSLYRAAQRRWHLQRDIKLMQADVATSSSGPMHKRSGVESAVVQQLAEWRDRTPTVTPMPLAEQPTPREEVRVCNVTVVSSSLSEGERPRQEESTRGAALGHSDSSAIVAVAVAAPPTPRAEHTQSLKPLAHRRPHSFSHQLQVFLHRAFRQQRANPARLLLFLVTMLLMGAVIGIMFGPQIVFIDLGVKLLLSELCLCLVGGASGLQALFGERLLYFRETASGTNPAAYFVAKCIVQMLVGGLLPLMFSITYIAFGSPTASALDLVAIFSVIQWAAGGVGMVVAVVFRRDAVVGLVCSMVLFLVFSTYSPRIDYYAEDLGMGYVGSQALTGWSFVRWTSEALLVTEWKGFPPAFDSLVAEGSKYYSYHLRSVWFPCVFAAFVSGIVLRVLAYRCMLHTQQAEQGSLVRQQHQDGSQGLSGGNTSSSPATINKFLRRSMREVPVQHLLSQKTPATSLSTEQAPASMVALHRAFIND